MTIHVTINYGYAFIIIYIQEIYILHCMYIDNIKVYKTISYRKSKHAYILI